MSTIGLEEMMELFGDEDNTPINKIFLGGTCNNTTWREELTPHLTIPFFNPIVEDWNEESRIKENEEKEKCNIHLYTITPEMVGVFSIAEAVESTLTGKKTLFVVVNDGSYDEGIVRSFNSTILMIRKHGGVSGFVTSTSDMIHYVREYIESIKQ